MNLQFCIGSIKLKISSAAIFSLLFLLPCVLKAQKDSINYDVTISGLVSTGKYSPFWLQSNQYGKISPSPISSNLLVGVNKEYNQRKRLFDYGFKANGLIQTNYSSSTIYFHELYAKARFSAFDLVIGSREEDLGNQDYNLSCGGLLFSRNARPMPKIHIGIDQFTTVPFTFDLLEIKGGLSHGWFTDNIYTKGLLLHHKYIYAKIGGKLPVHFQYGLDHVAQWGGIVPVFGHQPSGLKDYLAIFLGHSGGSDAIITDQINALGNHIISQSMRLDIDISDYKIGAYWQNISEDNPIKFIGNTMNAPDGLWGISIKNNNFPFIKGVLYEYLNTTDQSGPYHDKDGIVYGGVDNYFINGIYQNGWSYYSRIIGTPFITSALYNTNGEVRTFNNRVQVHHFGIEGDIYGYSYKALSSFSGNYGTYSTPINIKNVSTLLEINKRFPRLQNVEIGCSLGADFGNLYGNSVGFLISVKKRGNIFQY